MALCHSGTGHLALRFHHRTIAVHGARSRHDDCHDNVHADRAQELALELTAACYIPDIGVQPLLYLRHWPATQFPVRGITDILRTVS